MTFRLLASSRTLHSPANKPFLLPHGITFARLASPRLVGAMIATNKCKQITGDDLMGISDLSISNNHTTADGAENHRTSPRLMSTSANENNGTTSDVDGGREAFRTNDEILLGTNLALVFAIPPDNHVFLISYPFLINTYPYRSHA